MSHVEAGGHGAAIPLPALPRPSIVRDLPTLQCDDLRVPTLREIIVPVPLHRREPARRVPPRHGRTHDPRLELARNLSPRVVSSPSPPPSIRAIFRRRLTLPARLPSVLVINVRRGSAQQSGWVAEHGRVHGMVHPPASPNQVPPRIRRPVVGRPPALCLPPGDGPPTPGESLGTDEAPFPRGASSVRADLLWYHWVDWRAADF